jgi:hypothetical protein
MKMSAPARKSKWTFYFLSHAPAKSLSSMEEKKTSEFSLSMDRITSFYFILFSFTVIQYIHSQKKMYNK